MVIKVRCFVLVRSFMGEWMRVAALSGVEVIGKWVAM